MMEAERNIAGMKANIEAQLRERETAIREAAAWMAEWKYRQPKGFRAMRRTSVPQVKPRIAKPMSDDEMEFGSGG